MGWSVCLYLSKKLQTFENRRGLQFWKDHSSTISFITRTLWSRPTIVLVACSLSVEIESNIFLRCCVSDLQWMFLGLINSWLPYWKEGSGYRMISCPTERLCFWCKADHMLLAKLSTLWLLYSLAISYYGSRIILEINNTNTFHFSKLYFCVLVSILCLLRNTSYTTRHRNLTVMKTERFALKINSWKESRLQTLN